MLGVGSYEIRGIKEKQFKKKHYYRSSSDSGYISGSVTVYES